MWLRTLEGWTLIGWMSSRVSESMPWLCRSCWISSVSAKIDTENKRELTPHSAAQNPSGTYILYTSYPEPRHQAWVWWRNVCWGDRSLQVLRNPDRSIKNKEWHSYNVNYQQLMFYFLSFFSLWDIGNTLYGQRYLDTWPLHQHVFLPQTVLLYASTKLEAYNCVECISIM